MFQISDILLQPIDPLRLDCLLRDDPSQSLELVFHFADFIHNCL
jgi:hypothetical protein